MNASDNCPFCGTHGVIPGSIHKSEGAYGFLPTEIRRGFKVTGRRVFAFAFGPDATFCAHCNMVWTKADAADAADFIRKFGTEGLRAQFEAVHQTQPPPT